MTLSGNGKTRALTESSTMPRYCLLWIKPWEGDKRLATRHGSHMADATINILDSSLAVPGMGAVWQMTTSVSWVLGQPSGMGAVINETPVNSAKSTKGTAHCLTCPRNQGMEATFQDGTGRHQYQFDLRTSSTSWSSLPQPLHSTLVPGWELSTCEARVWKLEKGEPWEEERKRESRSNVSSILQMCFCTCRDEGEDLNLPEEAFLLSVRSLIFSKRRRSWSCDKALQQSQQEERLQNTFLLHLQTLPMMVHHK
ncbi:hypothetical protein E2C01_030608 [Portunus trituberculatus]|uniref:Uncharacterized protein n=1 Tax=Portunus trituberculatus TaxID=210409 RepID=A0A5B7EUP2_PORTR|nr:hypothetical protein [Portunus trituberculatus]